jgi:hypothetical protein
MITTTRTDKICGVGYFAKTATALISSKCNKMVEVFKTNVADTKQARLLTAKIHLMFGYAASFDLEDCDKILRVQSDGGTIQAADLIRLLCHHGFQAEVLTDEVSLY